MYTYIRICVHTCNAYIQTCIKTNIQQMTNLRSELDGCFGAGPDRPAEATLFLPCCSCTTSGTTVKSWSLSRVLLPLHLPMGAARLSREAVKSKTFSLNTNSEIHAQETAATNAQDLRGVVGKASNQANVMPLATRSPSNMLLTLSRYF